MSTVELRAESLTGRLPPRCADKLSDLLVALEGDGVAREVPAQRSASPRSSSTIGVMLKGTTIENAVVGGPSWGILSKGDVILEVDGRHVGDDDVQLALLGGDQPGSKVCLQVQGVCGKRFEAEIFRVESAQIHDKRELMETFVELENKIEDSMDLTERQAALQLVDKAIARWSKMQVSETDTIRSFKSSCAARVRSLMEDMQSTLDAAIAEQAEAIRRLKEEEAHSAEMSDMLEQLTEDHYRLQQQLQHEHEARQILQQDLAAARGETQRLVADRQRLATSIELVQKELASVKQSYQEAQRDLRALQEAQQLREQGEKERGVQVVHTGVESGGGADTKERARRSDGLLWMRPILKEQEPKCWLDVVETGPAASGKVEASEGVGGNSGGGAGRGRCSAALVAALQMLHAEGVGEVVGDL